MRNAAVWVLAASVLCGCATEYSWRSRVPEDMRTVSVPVFRNETDITGFGTVAARQLLREFQREGTFRVAGKDDCAIEIQGLVKKTSSTMGYDRSTGGRVSKFTLDAEVEITVVDKRNGKLLMDNKSYTAKTTFMSNDDYLTGRRDASGRLAEELARQVVDDVLTLKW